MSFQHWSMSKPLSWSACRYLKNCRSKPRSSWESSSSSVSVNSGAIGNGTQGSLISSAKSCSSSSAVQRPTLHWRSHVVHHLLYRDRLALHGQQQKQEDFCAGRVYEVYRTDLCSFTFFVHLFIVKIIFFMIIIIIIFFVVFFYIIVCTTKCASTGKFEGAGGFGFTKTISVQLCNDKWTRKQGLMSQSLSCQRSAAAINTQQPQTSAYGAGAKREHRLSQHMHSNMRERGDWHTRVTT